MIRSASQRDPAPATWGSEAAHAHLIMEPAHQTSYDEILRLDFFRLGESEAEVADRDTKLNNISQYFAAYNLKKLLNNMPTL